MSCEEKIPMHKKYLCGVDYQHEMEVGMAQIYNSLEELKQKSKCWKECGIVEMELDKKGNELAHRWIEDQNFNWYKNPKKDPKA